MSGRILFAITTYRVLSIPAPIPSSQGTGSLSYYLSLWPKASIILDNIKVHVHTAPLVQKWPSISIHPVPTEPCWTWVPFTASISQHLTPVSPPLLLGFPCSLSWAWTHQTAKETKSNWASTKSPALTRHFPIISILAPVLWGGHTAPTRSLQGEKQCPESVRRLTLVNKPINGPSLLITKQNCVSRGVYEKYFQVH